MIHRTRGVIGMILAGGESRRMQQDKGLLSLEDFPTLLHRQMALLKPLPLDAVVISRHQKHGTPFDLSSHVIPDKNPDFHDGPLAGIAAVAAAYPDAKALLILPVDLPLMNQSLLEVLLEQGLNKGKTLHYRDEFFPLFLCLGQKERSYLREQLEVVTGNRSVRSLLRFCDAEELEHHQLQAFTNTNTESEWRAAQMIRIDYE